MLEDECERRSIVDLCMFSPPVGLALVLEILLYSTVYKSCRCWFCMEVEDKMLLYP